MLLNITRFFVLTPCWIGFLSLYFNALLLNSFAEVFFPELISEFIRDGIRMVLHFFYNLIAGVDDKIHKLFSHRRYFFPPENENPIQVGREDQENEGEGNFQDGAPPMDTALVEERHENPENQNDGEAGIEGVEEEVEVEDRNHGRPPAAVNLTGQAVNETPAPNQPNHSERHNHLPLPNLPRFPSRPRLPGFYLPQRTPSSTAAIASPPGNFLTHSFFSNDPRAKTSFQIDNLFAARGSSSSSSSTPRGLHTFFQPRGLLPRLHPDPSLIGRPRFSFRSGGFPGTLS